MRWLLMILVLVNGVVFYWFAQQQDQFEQHHQQMRAVPVADVSALVLLAERATSGPQPPVTAEDRCIVFGPVYRQAAFDRMVGGLQQAGVEPEQWRGYREMAIGYWVCLPPLESRDLAQQRLNELSSEGVDSFVFEEGNKANGISLGIYTSRPNAEKRKEEMLERGYLPEVEVATRREAEYWLQFDVGRKGVLSGKFWDDIEQMAPEAEISEKSCAAVASIPDIP